ncbi:MAG TPA: glycosyltransferase family 39 protein, partial [Gemmatimonadaceae bacterium]|nr:glycosyltransferase family 39 protein [Gemmatimonadaceae bacterium]
MTPSNAASRAHHRLGGQPLETIRSIDTSTNTRGDTRDAGSRLRHLSYNPTCVPRQNATGSTPAADPARWIRSPRDRVLVLILVTLIGRLILALTIGLGVDESYQVTVSRPLSLSYFEHPPLAFWIPGVIGVLTGSMNGALMRLPFILLFAGTTWMMYRLTARLFGERAGAIAALILNVSPVLSLSTGSWVLPDGPLMFWMLASALCLERVLLPSSIARDEPRTPTLWWILAGACAGLAMLSKYHGVFLLAGTGLFLLTNEHARRWLRHPGPYLGAVVAALVFSPVLLWNAQHQWVSFRFQGSRGASHGIHLASFLQNIGGQLGYLLPWICIPLAWVLGGVLIEAARRALQAISPARARDAAVHSPDDARTYAARWWLACLAIVPIATFELIALGGDRGLPHWQAPGWLMAIPLLAASVDSRLRDGSARVRRSTRLWLIGSTSAFVLVVLALATQARTGWVERLSPSLLASGDPTLETLDWRDLPAALAPMLRGTDRNPDAGPFVAATNWIDAAKISRALNGHADVVCLCTEPHHFAFVHAGRGYLARDAVIVERDGLRTRGSVPLSQYFRSVRPIGTTV